MPGICKMFQVNDVEYLKRFSKDTNPIQIPNDPELTGTGDWQGRKPLKEEEMLHLKAFLSFIKECNFICRENLPSSRIAGIYQKNGIFIKVSDEWNEVEQGIALYAAPVSSGFTQKYLLGIVQELKVTIPSLNNTSINVGALPKNAKREEEIEKLISDRIRITTPNKFVGWGNQKRKELLWKQIHRFVDLLDVYPTDNQIQHMHGMRHPSLNTRLTELRDEIEAFEKNIPIPIFESIEDLTAEEFLLYEAIVEYCRNVEFLGTCKDLNQNQILVFETKNNLVIELVLTEFATPNLGMKLVPFCIRKVNEIELKNVAFFAKLSSKFVPSVECDTDPTYGTPEYFMCIMYDALTFEFKNGISAIRDIERLVQYEENLQTFLS